MATDEDRAFKKLWDPVYLSNAANGAALYTLPADKLVIVREITLTNISGATKVIDIWYLPDDGAGAAKTPTNEFKHVHQVTLDASGMPLVLKVYWVLDAEGNAIQGKAATASHVNCMGHGVIESTA